MRSFGGLGRSIRLAAGGLVGSRAGPQAPAPGLAAGVKGVDRGARPLLRYRR